MAQPAWLNKYLTMKPEVTKIFDDLEAWHDHCRFNLLPFVPSDLYRSQEYRYFSRPPYQGDRKNFRKDYKPKSHNNDNFSR